MDTNFEQRIKLAEWTARLSGQETSKLNIGVEILKYERKIAVYKDSLEGLEKEIVKSKDEIAKMKGGE